LLWPTERWLNNHREAIAAFDFFTVPDLYFCALYYFVLIEDARRGIVSVIANPHDRWQHDSPSTSRQKVESWLPVSAAGVAD
jgi:hypothetical protein